MKVSHGRLNPHNILVCRKHDNNDITIKLSHMCCPSTGAQGWRSSEILENKGDMLSDIFSIGFIFHFCMLKGAHPFGKFNMRGEMTDVVSCEQQFGKRVYVDTTILFDKFYAIICLLLQRNKMSSYIIF
jgi:serine/threonine protein kinase